MLRAEFTANGPPNIPEFRTVKNEAEFDALREMSTYEHISPGTAYPALLFYHGYNDPRVDVWMSAKAAARFQAATTSRKPVLLDIDYGRGHGIGNTRAQHVLGRISGISTSSATESLVFGRNCVEVSTCIRAFPDLFVGHKRLNEAATRSREWRA